MFFSYGLVFSNSSCEGHWIISVRVHVRNELVLGYNGCLLYSIHSLDNFDVYISIRCYESLNLVLVSDFWWKIFWVHPHELCSWHWCFQEKYFRSQDITLAPLRESNIVILNSSFGSKRDAAGDDASLGYSSLSPPTVSLNRYGSDFRVW